MLGNIFITRVKVFVLYEIWNVKTHKVLRPSNRMKENVMESVVDLINGDKKGKNAGQW